MPTRAEIKREAKQAFHQSYGIALGGFLLYAIITGAVSSMTFGFGFLLSLPLMVGLTYFFNTLSRFEKPEIGDLFAGFSRYGRNLGALLWMELWTFLWSLLFVIPGIIKTLAYSMTPYILADCPNVSATDALKLSMRMTQGRKGQIFVFYLSFIGWYLLSMLTFGLLAIFYVGPYQMTAASALYYEIKRDAIIEGRVDATELA